MHNAARDAVIVFRSFGNAMAEPRWSRDPTNKLDPGSNELILGSLIASDIESVRQPNHTLASSDVGIAHRDFVTSSRIPVANLQRIRQLAMPTTLISTSERPSPLGAAAPLSPSFRPDAAASPLS